jgi:hypothetical protein
MRREFALLGLNPGRVIINSMIMELPTEKEGRFWPFCLHVLASPVADLRRGDLGNDGWSGKAEDESGCEYRQGAASQRRQNLHCRG